MTVCIAALSSWIDPVLGVRKPALILAADRMITSRTSSEYELLDQTKVFWFGPKVAVLVSGAVDALLSVCQDAYAKIQGQNVETVPEMAAVLADSFQGNRRKQAERLHLEPYGLTMESFVCGQNQMAPEFRERIENAIDGAHIDIGEAIVAGIDPSGAPHLFTVEDPGLEQEWNATGFVAIGIGAGHAETMFLASLYTPNRDWLMAMTITFFAKKRAERAPGVGPNTDLYYITENWTQYFEPASRTVQELDAMYHARVVAEQTEILHNATDLGRILREEGYAEATESQERAGQVNQAERDAPPKDAKIAEGSDSEGPSKAIR